MPEVRPCQQSCQLVPKSKIMMKTFITRRGENCPRTTQTARFFQQKLHGWALNFHQACERRKSWHKLERRFCFNLLLYSFLVPSTLVTWNGTYLSVGALSLRGTMCAPERDAKRTDPLPFKSSVWSFFSESLACSQQSDADLLEVSEEEVRNYCHDDKVVKHITPVAMVCVGAMAAFRLYVEEDASAEGRCGTDSGVALGTMWPHFLCSFFSLITTVLFWHKRFAEVTKTHYHTICACQLLQIYVTTLASETLMALHRSNYATCALPPGRDNPFSIHLMCGKELGKYVSIFSSCAMFSMSGVATAAMCVFACATFVVANVVLGAPPVLVLLATLFQLGVGLSAAYLSKSHLDSMRTEYCAIKATRFATEQTRDVLYTLLPRDVLMKLETPGGHCLLGTSSTIPTSCILFVHTSCIQPATPSSFRSPIAAEAAARNARTPAGSPDQGLAAQKQFECLHEIFCKWDDLVEGAGLIKYQHVNEWYIVACPRAASPYDCNLQSQPYPSQYFSAMVTLADDILRVIRNYRFRAPATEGTTISVKIGIHIGPVAGVVLGKQRSFYALYGDSVNTAARMAQSAAPGKVLVSKSFADGLMACPRASASFACVSNGLKHVKGLGDVESFEVARLRTTEHHAYRDANNAAAADSAGSAQNNDKVNKTRMARSLSCDGAGALGLVGFNAGSTPALSHSDSDLTEGFGESVVVGAGSGNLPPMSPPQRILSTAERIAREKMMSGAGTLGFAVSRWVDSAHFRTKGWVSGFTPLVEEAFQEFVDCRTGQSETRVLSVLLHIVAVALQWRFTLLVYSSSSRALPVWEPASAAAAQGERESRGLSGALWGSGGGVTALEGGTWTRARFGLCLFHFMWCHLR